MAYRPMISGATALLLSSVALAQSAASAPEAAASAAPAPSTRAAAPAEAADGKVAYYGRKFAGRRTASGERFDPDALTMAHKTLPFGTMVRVTNLKNDKSVVVRVNDRGPGNAELVGDLSLAAARKIGMVRAGVADVRLEVTGTREPRKAK